MKKKSTAALGILLFMLAVCVIFTGCGAGGTGGTGGAGSENGDSQKTAANLQEASETADHGHEPASSAQMIDDSEPAGYCGNTVTKIRTPDEEEYSFWGSDSVRLTDLLLKLDYSEDVCRCLPEYTVNLEVGSDYGINLTDFYVRHDGGQVQLTEDQVREIREIIDRNCASRTNCYPDENSSR